MTPFRPFMAVMLAVLMLPWGAYARASSASMTGVEMTPHAFVEVLAPTQVAKTHRTGHCRTATLPGSACAHFLDPGATAPVRQTPDATAAHRPTEASRARSLTGAPPRSPPRPL